MRRKLLSAAGICGLIAALSYPMWSVHAQDAQRLGRLTLTNGQVIEGEITETPEGYTIVIKLGPKGTRTDRYPRSAVREVAWIDASSSAGAAAAAAVTGQLITPEELEVILGPPETYAILEEFGEAAADTMEAAPLDNEGVAQMERIAGPAAQRYITPHFVLVYTSEEKLARDLGARLEKVYEHCVSFMERLGVPPRRPDAKLEVYFFGTHKEYTAYMALDLGTTSVGVLGFYMPPTNRSAFFAMHDWPPLAQQLEQLRQVSRDRTVDITTRRRIQNRVDRMAEHYNMEVVQHEAAHHIHFNMGLFNRRAPYARWLPEGMAQMFECPPSDLGASLRVMNHYRLKQFRQIHGDNREKFPPGYLQYFLWSMPWGAFSAADYPLGWAICNYLWNKQQEDFSKFLLAVSQMEDDVELSTTERQKMWEDALGRPDEEWEKKFFKYMNSIQLKTEHLPDWEP